MRFLHMALTVLQGTFLIRISERANGYALSFRYQDRCRHYKLCISDNVCNTK